jgi:phenylacetate-CoA ligase
VYSRIYSTVRRFWPGGPETHRHLKELEKTQWLSRDELAVWHLARLRQLVSYAREHVPYYRELYKKRGIRPEAIKGIHDFEQLPFLTREEINNNLDSLVSPEFSDRLRPNSTGGSTGQPMRFFVDRSYDWWDAALEFRGRGWYGVSEGDKVAWVWGAERDMHVRSRKARLKATIQQNRYLNAFGMSEESMEAFAEMLVRWRPDMFRAYASALSLFARYLQDHGITGIRPKLIETTAEKITDPQRELLEGVFGCKVADWYTARELGTIGFQCPHGGMHVCETRYLEVIANGKPAAPGELGEVVLTSLHQYGMPFIRYKIGDMAHTGFPCHGRWPFCSWRVLSSHVPRMAGDQRISGIPTESGKLRSANCLQKTSRFRLARTIGHGDPAAFRTGDEDLHPDRGPYPVDQGRQASFYYLRRQAGFRLNADLQRVPPG